MFRLCARMSPSIAMALLVGCSYFPVTHHVDEAVGKLASPPLDVLPHAEADATLPAEALPPPPPDKPGVDATPPGDKGVGPEAKDGKLPPPRLMSDRLPVPREFPGGNTPAIQLPADPAARKAALEKLYPPLPALGNDVAPPPGPDDQPLSLTQLQLLAVTNSPLIRQAAADVEAAKGAARQALAYPNPIVGYEGDQIGAAGKAGQQGIFIDQLIKTGGKLQLAHAAARMDVLNAQVALFRAHSDLASQVRAGYFAALVAQENVKIARSLVRFTDEVYAIQVELVKGAQAAAYEPLQLRVITFQARGQLVQARNRYVSSWKQLAATLGLPALPPTSLEGRADMPIPRYQYDALLAKVLNTHTDLAAAENTLLRARYNLRLAQVQPVPDVDVRFTVQKDFGGDPSLMQTTVNVGVPVPLWDRNKGGIAQAHAALVRAEEEAHRVRDDLTGRLAEAYERYDDNRRLLEYYREHILPDQVRAYRGVYERHQQEPDRVSFGDVVTAQQTLATTVTGYVTTLGQMWIAVVDVANLLQTKDLFQVGPEMPGTDCPAPVPDLAHLPELPCCHPSSPIGEPWLRGADGEWPPAAPK